jgi:hypothetical protein
VLDLIENLILGIDFLMRAISFADDVPCTNTTHPELTRFITCIVPDFLDVCGVCLLLIWGDVVERNTSYVKNPVTLQLSFRDL